MHGEGSQMRRYRIGMMVGTMPSDYPRSLRLGAQNTIEEAGHILVAISDLLPRRKIPNDIAYYRMAFQLASRFDLDALIVPVGSVVAHLRGDDESAMAMLSAIDPARTIIMERDIPGYRCVNKDNTPGMRECMRHLIEDCGFTKIAFISGLEASKGAREREAIYFEEMAAHGLDTPDSLFARGLFSGECADVIEQVIDDNPDLEAIACACDLIAYTTYRVLHRRGLAVGTDIAVTGFDDHVRSAHLDPPLSTVHMTGYDYGCMAAREALRLCAGLPQREFVMNSHFVVRSSCGENTHTSVERFVELLKCESPGVDGLVSAMVDATLFMAGPRAVRDFRDKMEAFLLKVHNAYLYHRAHPDEEVLMFSSHDLSLLFDQEYQEHLSLEGFHTAAISMLEALLESSPSEDTNWIVEQISHLHLRVARMLTAFTQQDSVERDDREWLTSHMVDDALRMDNNVEEAFRLILQDLDGLGVREADLFSIPEPVEFAGVTGFALSDAIRPIARLSYGSIEVDVHREPIVFQQLLEYVVPRYAISSTVCSIGGIVAGNELVGLAVFDPGTLTASRQLMMLLNLGFAFKHLQMIASQREMNELLNKNNLLLEQQSQHDMLTGLLNRRGYLNRIGHLLQENSGHEAAIVFFDLDGLKLINDKYGHDSGDEAICAAARILERHVPRDGLLARLGGDEFVSFFVLQEDDCPDQLTQSIFEDIRAYNERGEVPYELSVSLGVVRFVIKEDTQTHLAELTAEADERLYQMKRQRPHRRR